MSMELENWALAAAAAALASPAVHAKAEPVACEQGYAEPAAHEGEGLLVVRAGSGTRFCGGAPYFTGVVSYDAAFASSPASALSGATVHFSPSARTAWHSHPLGQTFVVLSGKGWVQAQGGPIVEVRRGDVVYTPPGVKHWHGATTRSAMSHVAVSQTLPGKTDEWFGPVSDADYQKGPTQ